MHKTANKTWLDALSGDLQNSGLPALDKAKMKAELWTAIFKGIKGSSVERGEVPAAISRRSLDRELGGDIYVVFPNFLIFYIFAQKLFF